MDYKYSQTKDYYDAMQALENTKFDYSDDRELIANVYASLVNRYPGINKAQMLDRLKLLQSVKVSKELDENSRVSGDFFKKEEKIEFMEIRPLEVLKSNSQFEEQLLTRQSVLIHEAIHAMTCFDNSIVKQFDKAGEKVPEIDYLNEACTEYMSYLTCKDLGIETTAMKFSNLNGTPTFGDGYQLINRAAKAMEIIGEDVPSSLFNEGYQYKTLETQYIPLYNSMRLLSLNPFGTYDSWKLTREIYRLNFVNSYLSSDNFEDYMRKSIELYKTVSEEVELEHHQFRSQCDEFSKQDILMWCKINGIPPEAAQSMNTSKLSPAVDNFVKCCKIIREYGKTYTDEEFRNAEYAFSKNSFSIKIGGDIIEGSFEKYRNPIEEQFYSGMPDNREYFRVVLGPQGDLGKYFSLGFFEEDLKTSTELQTKQGRFYEAFTNDSKAIRQVYLHMNHISRELAHINTVEDLVKLQVLNGPDGKPIIETLLKSENFADCITFISQCAPELVPAKYRDIGYIAEVIGRNPLCELCENSNLDHNTTDKLGWNPNFEYKGESLAKKLVEQTTDNDSFFVDYSMLYKWKLDLDTPVKDRTLRDYIADFSPEIVIRCLYIYPSSELFPGVQPSMEKDLFSNNIPQAIALVEKYEQERDLTYLLGAVCHGLSSKDIPWEIYQDNSISLKDMEANRDLAKQLSQFLEDETKDGNSSLIEETKAKVEIALTVNKDPEWLKAVLDEYKEEKEKVLEKAENSKEK